MFTISTTDRLGLVKPTINDEVHQTINDLAQNFEIIDKASDIYMSSPPTTGFWKKAQKIWNESVSSGSVLGWINVREGVSAPTWRSLISYQVGDLIVPNEDNGHYYRCIQTGVSGVTEPIFPLTADGTVDDTRGGATWQANRSYNIGDIVFPTFSNNRFYVATVAGTTGSSEPNWSLVDGGTVSDGSVTWTGYRICTWQEEGTASNFRPFGEIG